MALVRPFVFALAAGLLVTPFVGCVAGATPPFPGSALFAGTAPELAPDDLAPLVDSLATARVVGLGEGTHGTREFFDAKHRIVRALVATGRPVVFAIEAAAAPSDAVGDYVAGGDGDPAALARGMGFWTWSTEEVAGLIRWMRAARAAGSPVAFTGMDIQDPDSSAREVLAFVHRWAPALAEEADATFAGLGAREGFASVSTSVSGATIAGRRVEVRGRVRTRGVDAGWASVWFRADGPVAGRSLAFDNDEDDGARGTTSWRDVSVAVDVPEGATEGWFGVLHVGGGDAWFDDLALLVDGAPAREPFRFDDGGLDGLSPAGKPPTGRGYTVTVESGALHVAGAPQAPFERVQALSDALLAARETLVAAAGVAATDRALYHARVTAQAARRAGASWATRSRLRDRSMADNVSWIHAHAPPEAIVVLWAHNAHVALRDGRMGAHLRETFGAGYVSVGFATGRGTYRAAPRDRASTEGTSVFQLAVPPAEACEAALLATGAPFLLVDLHVPGLPDACRSGRLRSIGALELDGARQFGTHPAASEHDWLVWVADSGASVALPR